MSKSLAGDVKPDAFILTGAFSVVCRDPIYIHYLVRRGLKVLLITAAHWREQALTHAGDPAHPASAIDELAFVDGSVESDGSFIPGVIEHAQRWRDQYNVVGVYAVGETLVEPTGLIADFFGLPFPGLRAARACRSKYLQRWYLPELNPAWLLVPPGGRGSFDREAVRFPAVVKPATRHSSLGVQTVYDHTELADQLGTYPANEAVLVEQKVTGQEFSVESLIQDGKVLFASVTQKETTDVHSRFFVEVAHTVPGKHNTTWDTVRLANELMLDRLAVENGITHAEWRVDRQGDAYLMEVAARTPGDGIMALYRLATGQRMEPEVLRIALGEPAAYAQPRRHARQVYLEHEPGLLQDVTVNWPRVEVEWIGPDAIWPEMEPGSADGPPALRAVLVTRSRGTELRPLRSSNDRAVTFFIDAPTLEQLDDLEQRVRHAVTIKITSP